MCGYSKLVDHLKHPEKRDYKIQNLLINVNRIGRHMLDNNTCERCGQQAETTLHAMRDCPLSKNQQCLVKNSSTDTLESLL